MVINNNALWCKSVARGIHAPQVRFESYMCDNNQVNIESNKKWRVKAFRDPISCGMLQNRWDNGFPPDIRERALTNPVLL